VLTQSRPAVKEIQSRVTGSGLLLQREVAQDDTGHSLHHIQVAAVTSRTYPSAPRITQQPTARRTCESEFDPLKIMQIMNSRRHPLKMAL
jgi:hypothetical protein